MTFFCLWVRRPPRTTRTDPPLPYTTHFRSARNAAEEGEGRHMAIAEGLADLRRIGFDKAGIRVRQVRGKEVRLALDPGDHHQGLAEIHLRMAGIVGRSEEHTSELQSLMRISYAVFCLKKKINQHNYTQ